MLNFKANVKKFMDGYLKDEHSRYRSYDYCHKLFLENRNRLNEKIIDDLALNLYTFLASWGMVCRTGILMKIDYKYLYKAVEVVCKDEYSWLIDIDIFAADFNRDKYVQSVLKLKKELDDAIFAGTDYKHKDTVICKIMLATLGCIHAYDTYIVKNLRALKYTGVCSEKGLYSILNFARDYKVDIQAVQAEYEGKTLVKYSPMKFIDMALWAE
ncbi:MAG: hypothetical protein K2I17_06300 [Clostridia bacterium]|nr:hypothetical protein [Clostridia bacterium]